MKRFLMKRIDLLVILFIIILINSSTMFLNYGFSDDYSLFYNYSTGNINEYRNMFLGIGRPINAILFEIFFSKISIISNLGILRIIGLLGIIFEVIIVYEILRRRGVNNPDFFTLILSLFTLPSISLMVSWATLFTLPFAMIFSTTSAFIIFYIQTKRTIPNLYRLLLYFVSFILLIFSLFIHQATGMYYWTIFCLLLFFGTNIKSNNFIKPFDFGVFIFIWTFSLALSYLWIRIASLSYSGSEIHRTFLASNFSHKIIWFVYEVIVRSLNFHLLSNNIWLPIVFLIVIIFGLYVFFENKNINT